MFIHTICTIHFNSDTNEIYLTQLDKKGIDLSSPTVYRTPDELPLDIRLKLATLELMGTNGTQVDGVGYIASPDTYLVYL